MANSEHVEIVKQGAEAIAAWRKRNASGRLDLGGADLSEADLSHADLSGANLEVAKLFNVNLCGADLRDSRLMLAYLAGTNLAGADLRRAQLGGTNLSGANLAGADLSECWCKSVVFVSVDLSAAKGLRTIVHVGPSTIDTHSLFLSKGRLPDVLLRGVGLGDWEIEAAKLYDPELSANEIIDIQRRIFELRRGSAIQIGSLFISYTHADGVFVDAIEEKLNEKGVRFWRDVHQATSGPLDEIVDRAIRLNPTVLLVLSEHSVASRWVEHEANAADRLSQELGRHTLCPIALDDAWKKSRWSGKLRTQIEKYNILPFNNWEDRAVFEKMFGRLIEGLAIFYQPEKPAAQ